MLRRELRLGFVECQRNKACRKSIARSQDSILSMSSRSPTFLLDPLQSPFREMGLILTNYAAKRSPRNAETLSGAAWVSPRYLPRSVGPLPVPTSLNQLSI